MVPPAMISSLPIMPVNTAPLWLIVVLSVPSYTLLLAVRPLLRVMALVVMVPVPVAVLSMR